MKIPRIIGCQILGIYIQPTEQIIARSNKISVHENQNVAHIWFYFKSKFK